MDQQKTGQYLKKLRNEKKLTQEQLAEKFNVSSRSVSRWETGRNLPDISLLVEIADFYEVDVREILEGEALPEEVDKMRELVSEAADSGKEAEMPDAEESEKDGIEKIKGQIVESQTKESQTVKKQSAVEQIVESQKEEKLAEEQRAESQIAFDKSATQKKSGKDDEIRDLAEKMADYANREKSRLLKFVQIISFAGVVIGIIAIVLQMISYEPDLRRSGAILATLVVTVVMAIISLYVAGILRKIVQNKRLFFAIKIITLILTGGVVTYTLLGIFTIGVFYLFGVTAKVEVYNDVAEYDKFFNNTGSEKYGVTSAKMFEVFPEQITSDMQVTEFQYMYYNPFDAQYITYMTVALDEKAYQKEIDRLNAIGTEEYLGIYSVTDEPQGYDLVAIDSDEYSGFVYAMVPEGANAEREITYVGIEFCNYFLDVDIRQYLPEEYLLKGFDASVDNPYREKMLP